MSEASPEEISQEEIYKWARRKTDRNKAFRFVNGIRYRHAPVFLGFEVSILGLLFGSIRMCSFTALGLSPIWLKIYEGGSALSWRQAIIVSAILFILLLYNYCYDKFSKSASTGKKKQKLQQKLYRNQSGIVSGISKFLKIKSKEHELNRDRAILSSLMTIRDAAKIFLGDFDGSYLEANLFVFNDKDCTTMRISHRTTNSRPINKVYPSHKVMAYHVAKYGNHRAVNDFVNDAHPFPKTGLSGGDPVYRSILFIPLIDTSSNGPNNCIGVVTLDSSLPYHFWPSNGEQLVLHLDLYVSLLTLLLSVGDTYRLNTINS